MIRSYFVEVISQRRGPKPRPLQSHSPHVVIGNLHEFLQEITTYVSCYFFSVYPKINFPDPAPSFLNLQGKHPGMRRGREFIHRDGAEWLDEIHNSITIQSNRTCIGRQKCIDISVHLIEVKEIYGVFLRNVTTMYFSTIRIENVGTCGGLLTPQNRQK